MLTYNWGNFFPRAAFEGEGAAGAPDFDIDILPGSEEVLDRKTNRLVRCADRPDLCPHAVEYVDADTGEVRLVNHAPYAAFGGWTAGVNPLSDSADEVQNFFAWLSSPAVSLEDVITDGGQSTPFQPYRYSHLKPELWTDKGYNADKVAEFTDATIASLESENVVIDLRIPTGDQLFGALDAAVSSYLNDTVRPEIEAGAAGRRRLAQGTAARTPADVAASLGAAFDEIARSFDESPENAGAGNSLKAQYQKSLDVYNAMQGSGSGGLSGGAIAGIVVGCVAGAAIAAAGVWFLRRSKEEKAYKIRFEDLTFGEQIGAGGFGVVCLGEYHGTEVAIKEIALRTRRGKGKRKNSIKRLGALSSRLSAGSSSTMNRLVTSRARRGAPGGGGPAPWRPPRVCARVGG